MKEKQSLNGSWRLFYFPDRSRDVQTPEGLCRATWVPATVPGNVELDLAAAGVIPQELFKGMATEKNYGLEDYAWWYEKSFALSEKATGNRVFLCFDGVDCLAEYYLNGEKIGASENAFRQIRMDITDKVRADGENLLQVHLRSATAYAYEKEYD